MGVPISCMMMLVILESGATRMEMAGLQRGGANTSSKAPTAPMIKPNNSRPVQVAVALSPGCIGLYLPCDASYLVWQCSAWSQVAGLPTAITTMATSRSDLVVGAYKSRRSMSNYFFQFHYILQVKCNLIQFLKMNVGQI